jgi:transcriptional regulator with XRE-family HTH domain
MQRKRLTIAIDGQKLMELRASRFLTQREFGELVGLSEGRVRGLENGRGSRVYASTFRRLAKALGMELEAFNELLTR